MSSGPTAVVLAGGASRRFGSDKLAALLDGRSLLDLVVDGLPPDATVLVVGPERALRRAVRFVREHPPGGGPAAALVTGVGEALRTDTQEILVLPGDAPQGGHAAGVLLQALRESPDAIAVVGTDASGFEQPLQLALRRCAAEQLVASGGPDRAAGQSARALVRRLDPAALRWPLPTADHWDVDTPEQLRAWQARDSDAVRAVLAAVDALAIGDRPVVVAVDDRSGSGKSPLAAALALARPATVIAMFHSAQLNRLDQSTRERLTDGEVADLVLDWRRLRAEVQRVPSGLVVLDGLHTGRPELADLVDLAVLVEVPENLQPVVHIRKPHRT